MLRPLRPAILAAALLAAPAALAGPAADKTAEHLYAGTLKAGEIELQAMAIASPDDAEAVAGLGMLQFAEAIERFAQGMYRHGLEPGGRSFGPLLRMPLPYNPSPEPLSYEELRAIFTTLSSDLDLAESTLSRVGAREVKQTRLMSTPASARASAMRCPKASSPSCVKREALPPCAA
mgnify:CR=1 FL=1